MDSMRAVIVSFGVLLLFLAVRREGLLLSFLRIVISCRALSALPMAD